MKKLKKAEVILEYQDIILEPPVSPKEMYGAATTNDNITIESWRDQWIEQAKANHKRFGSFSNHGLGKLYNYFNCRPCIVAGSGPSLKKNAHLLGTRDPNIGLISCLHNFHFLEDANAEVDFYVTLDAGDVTIEEVWEGGKHDAEYYWKKTEDKTLIAFISTHPKLLEKWRGKVYFFNSPVPDEAYKECVNSLERFNCLVSTGGNVLGAAFYISKAFFGANPTIFVGADFSFGYDHHFHSWDSKYDKNIGHVLKVTDIYGNKVKTWPSYYNFAAWFQAFASVVPGIYINATEGGCLGAFPEGNMMKIKQMDLEHVLEMYSLHRVLEPQCADPSNPDLEMRILY